MSLGLPEFGSRGSARDAPGLWRAVQVTGYVALSYALAIGVTEGMAASSANRSIQKAMAEGAAARGSAESAKRKLLKSPDLLIAASSVESSPDRVIADLMEILPDGVTLTSCRIEYPPETQARVEVVVIARGPEAYDRFLGALSKSPRFGDIRPGSESRPGLVRATVAALHRPKGAAR